MRGQGMKRLGQVYAMVERMRSADRRVAAAELDDAVYAAAIAVALHEAQRSEGRTALGEGDRAAWTIAETARQMMEMRIVRLGSVREELETALAAAAEVHRESRFRLEQMDRLVERAVALRGVDEGRREQAAADDRFGSRLAWGRGVEPE